MKLDSSVFTLSYKWKNTDLRGWTAADGWLYYGINSHSDEHTVFLVTYRLTYFL